MAEDSAAGVPHRICPARSAGASGLAGAWLSGAYTCVVGDCSPGAVTSVGTVCVGCALCFVFFCGAGVVVAEVGGCAAGAGCGAGGGAVRGRLLLRRRIRSGGGLLRRRGVLRSRCIPCSWGSLSQRRMNRVRRQAHRSVRQRMNLPRGALRKLRVGLIGKPGLCLCCL